MISITGIPFYDGLIEGFLFIPQKIAEFVSPNVYGIGFAIGVGLCVVIGLRLIFGWD